MLVEEVAKENEPVKFLSLTGIVVLVTTTTATADEIPPCPTPAGVSIIEKLSEAPTQLRMALAVDVGEMAEAGADFTQPIQSIRAWLQTGSFLRGIAAPFGS